MEDHRTDPRTDRLGVLLDQLDFAREIAQARLGGVASPASLPKGAPLPPRTGDGPLTDEEYLWEPAPGAWSLRRRGEAMSPRPFGPGEWQLDGAVGDPDPTPVTTIAWRLGHLHLDVAGSWEWTFGGRRRPPDQLVDSTPPGAAGAGGVAAGAAAAPPPTSWSTSAPRPRWRWSGSGRRWTAGVPASRP